LRLVIDPAALPIVLMALTGCLDRRERQAVAYLIEENQLLRRQRVDVGCASRTKVGVWPPERHRVGRAVLRQIATPAALLRWHRQAPSKTETSSCRVIALGSACRIHT
jgi:hypothetical protein